MTHYQCAVMLIHGAAGVQEQFKYLILFVLHTLPYAELFVSHTLHATEEEARTLAECIRAVIVVCSAVASQESVRFWDRDGIYPMVSREEGTEPGYHIDLVKTSLPPESHIQAVRLEEEALGSLRGQDYAVREVMELDHILSGAAVGKKNERKACASIALAVDAESGMVLAPEATDSRVAAGDALARVFLKAVQASRALPQEVRVRSQKLKECLAPLLASFGVTVRVARRLPAADDARSHLLGLYHGGTGER